MHGDWVCVAGYTDAGDCVRPLLRYGHLDEAWLFVGTSQVVRPFARVEIDLVRQVPCPPHTEDWEIQPTAPVLRGELDVSGRRAFLKALEDPNVESIFGAPVQHEMGYWVEAGCGTQSLGTVRVKVSQVSYRETDDGKWDYRITFADSSASYRLSVTDLAFRSYLDQQRKCRGIDPARAGFEMLRVLSQREVYFRLGLSRHWPKFPDRCYLQINGIYSFPDYLDGKCFGDFATSLGRRPAAPAMNNPSAQDLDDLPF